jgi:hypothetical protein
MQKRVKAFNVSIEGNYFPITSMAYIEDEKSRISIVVDHAQGAASWQQVIFKLSFELSNGQNHLNEI